MIKQGFLFFFSFFAVLAISELFIQTSNLADVSSTEFYDDIGRGRRRDLDYLYFNEGFGIGRFNQFRYIGEPNPPLKGENTVRIALLGDSYVESFQIFQRNYFGEVAEDQLESEFPDKKFEFLNFGRSGFDIGDIYAYQKNFVEKFNPDYIIYMVANADLIPKYSDPLRPKTILRNDSLVISFDFNKNEVKMFKMTKFLTQYSSILNMIHNGRKKTKSTPLFAILLDKVYFWFNSTKNKPNLSKNEVDNFGLNPITKKILSSLDSTKVLIFNRDTTELPQFFKHECLENNIKYFDLSEALIKMKKGGHDPNKWEVTNKIGHWNHAAHRLIGKELARSLNPLVIKENTK